MRIAAFICVLLLPSLANAGTFVSVDTDQYAWKYVFSIKSSAVALSTPLLIGEYDCNKEKWKTKDGKIVDLKFTQCFDTEDQARANAQQQADQFENDLKAHGLSTTDIETKRLWKKVTK